MPQHRGGQGTAYRVGRRLLPRGSWALSLVVSLGGKHHYLMSHLNALCIFFKYYFFKI